MMAGVFQVFLISISLAMDSFSVSIAGGMRSQTAKITHALKVAIFFGAFQALMPLIGWTIGETMKRFISPVDHWIAFILLGVIGARMIYEVLSNSEGKKQEIINTKILLMLSIATSIDALIVGITLNLLKTPIFVTISAIGIITFILSFFGFMFGRKIGKFFGKRVEILGGIFLIAIGLKILIEHLTV